MHRSSPLGELPHLGGGRNIPIRASHSLPDFPFFFSPIAKVGADLLAVGPFPDASAVWLSIDWPARCAGTVPTASLETTLSA